MATASRSRTRAQPTEVERDSPGLPASPRVPAPVAAATGALFRALSTVRGARIFHPRGVGYEATVAVERPVPGHRGVPLLEQPGEHRAVVRFSRAAGLPEPLPDVLGLSLRIRDLHGRGRHQDLLLVSSADAPLLHHLLLPAPGGFLAQSYSSVLPYRIGGKVRIVGALPLSAPRAGRPGAIHELVATAATGKLAFRLGLAPLWGRLDPVATLRVGERLPPDVVEGLAFNPWNCGGGIEPTGPFNGLRRSAYAGSQRGRGLSPARIP